MSRGYRHVRPRANLVYSVADVMALYEVCRNTLSSWVQAGLRPVDGHIPQLFRGAELVRFHKLRQARTGQQLRSGEFKCVRCKAAVFPEPSTLQICRNDDRAASAWAQCPDCGARVLKLLSETECNRLEKCVDTNTSLVPSDEYKMPDPAGIGTDQHSSGPEFESANDRILFAWQIYAGKYDAKTVDAHLISIRDFDRFCQGKSYSKVTKEDSGAYRKHLIERAGQRTEQGGLSRATVQHRSSHLKQFFVWLSNEPGYRALSGVGGYFALPKGLKAMSGREKSKVFPSLAQAEAMLESLPARDLKERRDRAIFAMCFLAGLRESALISLRLGHVDLERKEVMHDGATLRAKNGKTFVVNWFPRTPAFAQVVLAWVEEVRALGLRDDDVLFPDAKVLASAARWPLEGRETLTPMRTASAVDAVFARAGEGIGTRYLPHSARDTLADLGSKLCRTTEQHKAWSLNLGHSSEEITRRHYAKVGDARKAEIFEDFEVVELYLDEEKDLLLRYYEYQIDRDDPDFERAQALVERRRSR
ncbi:site-specific tyrosine recombinase XerS [Aquimixticola soesokkakensis]|uniref:Site-specific tyrosine recombinase XerS n=2 Tax=Aquimixticola soesokkakensis TaxID=1519096 RepID=A0A1Y5SCE7_9RHOB|nr:site-specific tyrosine recombinase XerS [Aquimixticola soesokkakensis]